MKLMERLDKLADLQKRDRELKSQVKKLNDEISEFISKDLGIEGQATLVDILKTALECTIEPTPKD